MPMKSHEARVSDVMYEFSLAKPIPDAELLDQFVRRFPQHAAALTDLAISIVLDAARPDEEDVTEVNTSMSPAVSRAMSRFQNRLYEVKKEQKPSVAPPSAQSPSLENPFSRLNRTDFRALTERLHGNTVFVSMLRDREIDPNTLSSGFEQFVADQLTAPIELVAAHFAAQQSAQTGQFYKSEDKPHTGKKISFEDAVRKSGLTQEQQRFLLSL